MPNRRFPLRRFNATGESIYRKSVTLHFSAATAPATAKPGARPGASCSCSRANWQRAFGVGALDGRRFPRLQPQTARRTSIRRENVHPKVVQERRCAGRLRGARR